MTITRADLLALDDRDPLRSFRDRFDIPDDLVYLDGNSLGPLPREARARILDVVEREWGRDLIRSWTDNDWIGLPHRIGALIARLIGAAPDEVAAADSTSVNVFKLAAAALALRPARRVVVSEPGNFPTDIYMVQGLAELLGPDRVELRLVERDRLAGAMTPDTALLLLTHVHYKTGAVHDMAGLTAAAHAAGALTLWDLAHSAGALPVDLTGCGADLAVGCGYKYLNGGPGAPAFLYVAKHLQEKAQQPLSGWLGHRAPFAFDDAYAPAPGIGRHLCGTPPVLSMSALEVGAAIAAEADMALVRDKSIRLGDLFISLVEQMCGPDAFRLISPRDGTRRGSQVSFAHPDGYAMVQALIARGVIGDFRAPDVLRFGFAPLYVRYADVWTAASHLADILRDGFWREARFQAKKAVT